MSLEKLGSASLTIAALALAGIAIRREVASTRSATVAPLAAAQPTRLSNWREAREVGRLIGPERAAVEVVVLSDLECPACRSFHRAIDSVMAKHPGQVSARFVHFPLQQHRFAEAAAKAAECAQEQGQFKALVRAIFDKQDSLGLKSWGSYARDAGIVDTARVGACARDAATAPRITEGMAFGNRIGVQFTPTVIVGGWRLTSVPSLTELDRIVSVLLQGGIPFDTSAGRPS